MVYSTVVQEKCAKFVVFLHTMEKGAVPCRGLQVLFCTTHTWTCPNSGQRQASRLRDLCNEHPDMFISDICNRFRTVPELFQKDSDVLLLGLLCLSSSLRTLWTAFLHRLPTQSNPAFNTSSISFPSPVQSHSFLLSFSLPFSIPFLFLISFSALAGRRARWGR